MKKGYLTIGCVVLNVILVLMVLSGCEKISQPDNLSSNEINNDTDIKIESVIESPEDYYLSVEAGTIEYEFPDFSAEFAKLSKDIENEYYNFVPVSANSSKLREKNGTYYFRRDLKVIRNKTVIIDEICGNEINSYEFEGKEEYTNEPLRMVYFTCVIIIDEDGNTESFIVDKYDLENNRMMEIKEIAGIDDAGILYFLASDVSKPENYVVTYDATKKECNFLKATIKSNLFYLSFVFK